MPFAINAQGGWRAVDGEADLLEGETYSAAQPPIAFAPAVPQQVTRFQARAALYQAGLLDQVEAAISAPGTDKMLKLAWQDAQAFKRDSQFVSGMAQTLGLTAQQLDNLFISASQIE